MLTAWTQHCCCEAGPEPKSVTFFGVCFLADYGLITIPVAQREFRLRKQQKVSTIHDLHASANI